MNREIKYRAFHKTIHHSIRELIDKEQENKLLHEMDMLDHSKERLVAEKYKQEYLFPRLKDASSRHYKKWLKGYLAKGGIPTHHYDYDWRGFIATDSIILKPLFGAQAISIIIPCDINIEGHTGHCNVFLMKDFGYMGWGNFAPVYRDTIIYE